MVKDNKKTAPYAATGSVLSVIRRYREHGAPKVVNMTEIMRVGVSEGNASRTLVALKFLGLVEKNEELSDQFKLLNKATTDEYSKVLGDIVRNAYSDVFMILDPSKATELQITDAFRGYEPEKQRLRMVALFIGLCQEAKIIEGKPVVVEGRKYSPESRPSDNGGGRKKSGNDSGRQPPYEPNFWVEKFEQYLKELPPSDSPSWTKSQRGKWLNAFTARLDYLIEVNDEGV